MLTDKVRALRRKPIGEAALETLIALNQNSIAIMMQRSVSPTGEYLLIDTLKTLDESTLENGYALLSSQTNIRLFDALLSLCGRDFIEKIETKEWIKQKNLSTVQKQKLMHEQNIARAGGRRGSDWFMYKITRDGKQALLDMPNRVQAFWTEKNSTPRYMISSLEVNGVKMASGIYPIERETEDKIFIRKETVPGACEFNANDPIHGSTTYQRTVGIYINRSHLLAMDVQPEDFNRLYSITKEYFSECAGIQRESLEKIQLIYDEERLDTNNLTVKINLRLKEEMERLQTIQLAKQENANEQGFVLTLEDSDPFKP